MKIRAWQSVLWYFGIPAAWTLVCIGLFRAFDAFSHAGLFAAIWFCGLALIGGLLTVQYFTKLRVREEFRHFFRTVKSPMLVFDLVELAKWAEARAIPQLENYEQYLRLRRPLCEEILDKVDLLAINPAGLEFFGAKTQFELDERRAEIFIESAIVTCCSAFLQAARSVQPGELSLELGTFGQPASRHILAEWMVLTPSMPRSGALIVYLFDLSDRKRAEQALVESERKMRSFMRAVPSGLCVVSSDRRFLMVNERLCEMVQFSPDELIGVSTRVIYEDEADFVRVGTALRVGVSASESITLQCMFRRKNGEVRDAVFSLSLLDARNPDAGFICAVQDTTDMKKTELDRQQLQLQLTHAQKLESIGRIVAGLAHDFQSILLAIRIQVDLLAEREHQSQEDRRLFENLSGECGRGIEMSRRMLSFGRRDSPVFEALDLRDQISNLLPIIRRVLGSQVELHFTALEKRYPVRGDPLMLDQIMLNLSSNARDAMPSGGQFRITLSRVDPLQARELDLKNPGRHVLIRVSDSGVGIRPENLNRLFEPFFTTKAKGIGTGLGLMIVDNLVRMHGGKILVSSTMNEGTEFRILIPECKD